MHTRLAPTGIVEPGRNCWRSDLAHRFYCIQDAADHFRLVREALLRARHTIFILGWDTTARTDLLPGQKPADGPTLLVDVLRHVARARPNLQGYVLTWDFGAIHLLERDLFTRFRFGWRMPKRIRFAFDDRHPIGGSHHQKIVVVDDELAFCGGIDLTGHRWDTCAHRAEEPRRITPQGKVYEPYHEVQAMVDGPAAASLGQLARDRWRVLGHDQLPAVRKAESSLWPAAVQPDLVNVNVAISRTVPEIDNEPAVRECEALFLDSIAAARQTIYIESQYFTNDKVGTALAARLEEPNGPEVIVVSPKVCHGWLEQNTIGKLRTRVFKKIVAADRHQRLRIVYPLASRAHDLPTFVHSKVMIVDDEHVRIGSANISHRSMGVDTECDLAVDADGDTASRAGIRHIRDRLVAEHLGVAVEAIAPAAAQHGSLRAVIDAHADADRCLARVEIPYDEEEPSPILEAAADPDEPIDFSSAIEHMAPASSGGFSWRTALAPVMRAIRKLPRFAPARTRQRRRAEFG